MNARRCRGLLATLIMLLATSGLAAKTWMPMTDEQLITGSDLIVVGKVVWVENGQVSTASKDRASILVQQVLKGDSSVIMAPLAFPGQNRGYLTWTGDFHSTRTNADIFFDIDQEGVWFLKYQQATGDYVIDHPARFKPLFFLEKIRQTLERR